MPCPKGPSSSSNPQKTIGRWYAAYLRDHGYSVTEVDSTDAGLSAAQAADLVITGVRVAGSFDGIELVRRLRGDDRTKDKPTIVI